MQYKIILCFLLISVFGILNVGASDKDVLKKFAELKSYPPEVGENAKKELDKVPFDDIVNNFSFILSKNEDPGLVLDVIGYIYLRNREDLMKVVRICLDDDIPRIRAAGIDLAEEKAADDAIQNKIYSLLKDENIIVRLYAAKFFEAAKPDADLLPVVISGLSSDQIDGQPYGGPPKCASLMAKSILKNWYDKNSLLEFLNSYHTENQKIKYHLIDIRAYLKGISNKMIYYYIGDPKPEDINKLNAMEKLLENP